ncbi:MAG TPA: flagellar hook-associated protein FlgK [Candidatus Deferrimicrobium sp.]|nr:flagellar hook-associated protein FlgK [Candidatus Deferrimicrobium sp.]
MMNLFSAIELGKNSILTQQQVFQVIGHNIANVNTPGYSRQVVDLENVRPSVIGLKDGGRGVNLAGIRSIRDRFIDSQITERKQCQGYYESLSGIMSTVESLFDESGGLGLSDSLTNFFNGWADVANNPTDIPTRNSLVSKAQSFSLATRNSYQRLTDQQEVYDANIGTLVDDINAITHEIAELNQKIAYAEGSGNPANDLLDIRERRLRELSEKIGINFYYEQANHSVTVEVAGRPLVSFSSVNELAVQRNPYNSNYYDLTIEQYGLPPANITTEVINGQMGALITARDGQTVNGAGLISGAVSAGGLTTLTFSRAHGLSVGDIITINGETRAVVQIPRDDQVVTADFTLLPTVGGGWQERNGYIPAYKKQLNKLAGGLIYNINALHQQGYGLNDGVAPLRDFFQMGPAPAGITVTGAAGNTVTFSASVAGILNVGDVLTIAGETRLITNVTGATVNVNNAFILAGGPNWEYANIQGAANTIQVDANIVTNSSLVAASSLPTAGVGGAVGNNDIARQIAQLMDANNVIDTDNSGSNDYGTFHEYLHSLCADVGNACSTAQYECDANGSMLTYLENKRDSISGVSLDEEAANLMQFEKSFQALGQFMATVSKLTDLLMQIT